MSMFEGSLAGRRALLAAVCAGLFSLQTGRAEVPAFPVLRVTYSHVWEAVWDGAPIVVAGRPHGVRALGYQRLEGTSTGRDPRVQGLYWCRARMEIDHVVRGVLSGGARDYVWASATPECRLGREKGTRVWFVRLEGEAIRPVYDVGMKYYDLLRGPGVRGPREITNLLLGERYLDPQAYGNGIADMQEEMFTIGHIACELLGNRKCIERLEELATKQTALRASVCQFLATEMKRECPGR